MRAKSDRKESVTEAQVKYYDRKCNVKYDVSCMQTDALEAKCCSLSNPWKPLICQSASGECSAAGRTNRTDVMLEMMRKGRDKTKSLRGGLTDGAFYRWEGKGCDLLYLHCK